MGERQQQTSTAPRSDDPTARLRRPTHTTLARIQLRGLPGAIMHYVQTQLWTRIYESTNAEEEAGFLQHPCDTNLHRPDESVTVQDR